MAGMIKFTFKFSSFFGNITCKTTSPFMLGSITSRKFSVKVEENENDIQKSIFISQSNNVFANLALEDWLYRTYDFSKHHVMLLWRNDPCVVIGRHQNPWLESNTEILEQRGISLARRNSGGGTVYHDKGNLNITFFTPKHRYNRLHNLQLIVDTLRTEWNLNVEVNKRLDIVLDSKYKVSGTASKLGRPNAYHHCTLLVDVDKENLSAVLGGSKEDKGIVTNATESVAAPTVNLSEAGGVCMERLMTALGWAYLSTSPLSQSHDGWARVATTRGFQLVSPQDDWFPGLGKSKEDLESWEWTFGRSPKFEVKRDIGNGVEMGVEVENGLVGDVELRLPGKCQESAVSMKMVTSLAGQRFTPCLLEALHRQVMLQIPPLLRQAVAATA